MQNSKLTTELKSRKDTSGVAEWTPPRWRKQSSGFTLIELILYIALVSIFITGAISFSWDVVYGREKAYQQQVVEQSARSALARISYEIRRAKNIQGVTDSQIVLDNGGSTTTINLSGGAIQITTGGAGPYRLTSNQVQISNLAFTQLTTTDKNSKNIKASITASQAQSGTSIHYQASATMTESVELNDQFNDARKLLVDSSSVSLSPNKKKIEGITIQNTGSSNIILDKLYVSWVGTGGGEHIVEVQIGGGGTEWSDSAVSGTTLDLTNYTLTSGSSAVVDYLEFDSQMNDATFDLKWILSDGSFTNSLISFAAATPTPTIAPSSTPTPTFAITPTPTPVINSCASYCQSLGGYTTGTCRQNVAQCNNNGETHQSGGDIYCTGGPNADTCCCKP